ncbi:DUF1836 domain-containing protein [Lactococcus insecticola]|uniref:DUF1836 domain-containing protein n=1 Tax=Pseudolactococcus insecticola TaxID=2709158 RepID=A0A6A0B8X7_9LACT|nr:DUF1836 domain-containing protein [Lactococcus insecticola]GFH41073.1 hypothetical protein Hs20B_14710 [Lactococcus insecticola]
MSESLNDWGQKIEVATLPRWDSLPDIDLYMDQVISLVTKYLAPIITTHDQALLTKSMVNNYVKLELVPAPVKKKYTRVHLAFLIAITLLKQVLTIPEIRTGIVYQGRVSGTHEAYNLFCDAQEHALKIIGRQAQGLETSGLFSEKIASNDFIVTAATASLAAKLLTQKNVQLAEVSDILKDNPPAPTTKVKAKTADKEKKETAHHDN